MMSYDILIMEMLKGETPKAKFNYLTEILNTLRTISEANDDVPQLPGFIIYKINKLLGKI